MGQKDIDPKEWLTLSSFARSDLPFPARIAITSNVHKSKTAGPHLKSFLPFFARSCSIRPIAIYLEAYMFRGMSDAVAIVKRPCAIQIL
jgi:hypothetical protein